MNTALTAFLCSTYSDLAEERASVLEAVRKVQLRHDSMEFFGARSEQPLEACLEEVRRSNILLVIVGHRYGSLVPKKRISYTEAEYTEGHRLKKPCLVYLRRDDVPVLPAHVERDPEKMRLLEDFKAKLLARHTVAYFQYANDLALSVAADLSRTIQTLEQTVRTEDTLPTEHEHLMAEVSSLIQDALQRGMSASTAVSAIRHSLAVELRAQGRRHARVFLSYSHRDKVVVRQFAEELRNRGVDVWMDETAIKVGDSLTNSISTALNEADFLVYFMSKASVESAWARMELNAILARRLEPGGPKILPILLEEAELPPLMRDVAYLDLRVTTVSDAADLLMKVIERQDEDSG